MKLPDTDKKNKKEGAAAVMRYASSVCFSIVCLVFSLSAGGLTSTKAGFNAGFVVPEHFGVTLGGGGLMDFCFDLGPSGSIHVQPTVELWYASDDHYNMYNQNYSWSVFEFSINPLGRYYFPVSPSLPVQPFAGVGFAFSMDFIHYENIPAPFPDHDNNSDLGFCISGGIDFTIGRNKAFVELRGKMGDIDVFKMLFGMMFPLGGSF
jgi:hypothetical protein